MNLLVCVNNEGYEASLVARKLYQRITDESAADVGMVRVVDESGEDYLYAATLFRPVQLSQEIERELFKKAA
jgi:hypothetical protein